MKKQDITPEIINLAKRIAEYWKMEIYEGCWIQNNYGKPCLELVTKTHLKSYLIESVTPEKHWFPIPSISDVLLKLDELNMIIYNLGQLEQGVDYRYLSDIWIVVIRKRYRDKSSEVEIKAPSLHEALLTALLGVLEKEK